MTSNRGFAGVGLYYPKNDLNVGATLRACWVYGAAYLAIQGKHYRRAPTDTGKSFQNLPMFEVDSLEAMVPFDTVPVAVDLLPDARPLPEYTHPRSAFYVFGPEDGTLGAKVTDFCRDVIYVPTNDCMNLAATVNVVLYDRMCKMGNVQKETTS